MMIRPRVVAYSMLALIALYLFYPRTVEAPSQAEINGLKAAKSAIAHRQLAEQAIAGWESAERETTAAIRAGARRVGAAVDTSFVALPVTFTDGHPIMGPHVETDTLMALPQVRLEVMAIVDTARTVIASIEMAVELERGRASLAIQHLQATIAAQDTVILGLRAELKRKAKPWYARASGGVVHAVAGVSCAGATYVLAGPIAAVGGGIVCAAIAGVVR